MIFEKYKLSSGEIAQRVQKRPAKRYYDSGQTILLVPTKCDLESMFARRFNKKSSDDNFEKIYNEYAFYNTGNELGQYLRCYLIQE